MAIPDLLRGCPLFFELYDTEIEKIVKFCQVRTHPAGDYVVRDGEKGDEIFIVLDGVVTVKKSTPNGVVSIQSLSRGDVFGEMVLVDERHRSADIVAERLSYVLEIRYEDFFGVFTREPRIFGLLILNLSRLLAKRLRSSNQIIVKLQGELAAAGKKAA